MDRLSRTRGLAWWGRGQRTARGRMPGWGGCMKEAAAYVGEHYPSVKLWP